MAEAVQQVAAGNAPALPEQAKETEQIAASSTPSPDVRRALARARAYQRELFEEACKQNIVAFLDTGSGKTLISILLIRHKMDELKHNVGPNKKLAIFLAPEVALVVQQAEVIRFHTNFSVGHYYGEKGVDFWKLHEWQKQFAQNDVLVMTHQILSNMLKSGFITMERIHLLIFDECHHVKKGHAGNVIMQEFYHNPRYQGSRPHIFGMTASPLDQKSQGKDKTAQFFDELERNLNAKVMTVADRSELDRIVHKPIESIIKYPGTVTNAATGEVLVQLEVICQNLTATSQLKQMELQEADVQRAGLVSAGVTFDREKRSTASGIMARNLRGVAHILKTLGPFCAGMCLKEILTPPTKRGRISDERHKSAEAHPKFGAFLDSDSEDELDDIRDDTWWVGAARAKPVAPSNSSEGTALTEAFSEATQLLCHLLLSHLPSKAQIAADIRADKSTWADARQHLVAALACTLDQIPTSRLDLEIDAVMSAMERGVSSAHASAMAPLVSAKAAVLVRHLQQYQEAASAKPAQPGSLKWSAIVFAKRKLTVVALNRLISQVPKLAFLKPMAIMGHGGLPALSLSVKKQQEVLELVRKGAVNLLVSTAVAEEGLDLVQCAVVVRYDLPDRPVDYIQSRGRARAPNSRMVLMVERDNPLEHQLIDDVRRCDNSIATAKIVTRHVISPNLSQL